MKKMIDVRDMSNKLEEVIKKSGFVYMDELPEGITIGMEDGTIIIGTKKERTAATVVL